MILTMMVNPTYSQNLTNIQDSTYNIEDDFEKIYSSNLPEIMILVGIIIALIVQGVMLYDLVQFKNDNCDKNDNIENDSEKSFVGSTTIFFGDRTEKSVGSCATCLGWTFDYTLQICKWMVISLMWACFIWAVIILVALSFPPDGKIPEELKQLSELMSIKSL